MEYLRTVDPAALEKPNAKGVARQILHDEASGATGCRVNCLKTLSGQGSPEGIHTHPHEQLYYLLSGKMGLEIDGAQYSAGPGTLVVLPPNVPHRFWNSSTEPLVHLSINAMVPHAT